MRLSTFRVCASTLAGLAGLAHGQIDAPELKWSWHSSLVEPDSVNVASTPVVLDLDRDGVPEVVFVTTDSRDFFEPAGILRVLDGATGLEKLNILSPTVAAGISAALGDIDGDGRGEILAASADGTRVYCFEDDGRLKWRSDRATTAVFHGGITLADLDADGTTEIIFGADVFDHNGRREWAMPGAAGPYFMPGSFAVATDLDKDGLQEVIAGSAVFRADGTAVFDGGTLGVCAPDDLDDDGTPEIAVLGWLNGSILGLDGAPKQTFRATVPQGRTGAPATGDLDGDGLREIVFANDINNVRAFNSFGGYAWIELNEDQSGVTGVTLFDFDNDGRDEVITRDYQSVRVRDGFGGTEIFSIASASCTWTEYAFVADVDASGAADLVVPGSCGFGMIQGVQVYTSLETPWARARPIWNQYAYHFAGIRPDGSIPAAPEPTWTYGVGFRNATLPDEDATCAADLTGSSDPNSPLYGVPDGNSDAADFFFYLDQFVAGNLAIADLSGSSDPNDPSYGTPDGLLDGADFFYYLDVFVLGC